ncbi:hypothetical protein NEOC84_001942|uniref:lantibiotic dehydratase n=1 Tax=Neochlamydia sp. AcF84 TaxID=2315858 RepID=UPI001407267E|nr:lantibiotic dehydratase [Neochlamydia sp. AcF84]NGY96010.1 hypothetical protein [Neochlamydia sp. AcF84]
MNKNPFIPAPFFLIRTPLWPVEDYERILAKENWSKVLLDLYNTHELLREAIAIASPSLYSSLKQKPLKNPQQVATSLLNYVMRMATRATPFGLFSFVMSGSWTNTTEVSFNLKQIYKRVRPDMEWVFSLIQQYYKDENLFASLSIQANRLAWLNGDRYFLNYIRQTENTLSSSSKTISVRATSLVRSILNLAQEPIKIDDLWKILQTSTALLDRSKTLKVIQELLNQQFLLPGILPSLLSHSPFEDLISHLPPSIQIENISKNIQDYNSLQPGKGEAVLQQLQKEMSVMAPAKTFLQVDLASKGQEPQISKNVLEEIEKAIGVLWKISAREAHLSPLKKYREKFIEKYGFHRTVPLMELISEERGLGPLEKHQMLGSSGLQSKFSQQWDKWLNKEWQKCLHEKKQEIVITEHLIDGLFDLAQELTPNPSEALLSLDVFCKIFADSTEQIDKGNFLLLISQTMWEGGSTLGRFLDLLGNNVEAKLQKFLHEEEQLEPNSLFAELSYWPSSIRSANVAIQPCLRSHRLDIDAKTQEAGSLSLDDIYVGSTHKRFYLTTKEGKCEIIPRVGNLLNPIQAPSPLRFIREVHLDRYQLIHPFAFDKLIKNAVFLPRVRFQKTILSPAQWNLDAAPMIKEQIENIIFMFNSWADQWNLPRRFFIVHGDQHLLLDRQHPAHLSEIAKQLKKGKSLQFIENIGYSWVKSEQGHHLSEIVIPFLKNPLCATEKKSLVPLPYFSVPFESRWKLPGSEWLFIKFYLEDEETDRFLIQHLSGFAKCVQQEIECVGWFFIRYGDPGKHLRFRLQIKSWELLSYTLSRLEQVSKAWMKMGLIKNVALDTYEREIERYGGLKLMDAAEAVFCADTLSTIDLLNSFMNKKFTCHPFIVQALIVINFLKDFGLTQREICSLINYPEEDRSELKGFREHKKQLVELAKALKTNFENQLPSEIAIIKKASTLRVHAIESFCLEAESISYDTRLEIYNSMLHMHCNRLGFDAKIEKRARLYAYQTLLQLQHLQEEI